MNDEGGQAFFRLESGKGEEVIERLSSRVELSRVGEILRMYCKAITGTNVSIQSGERAGRKRRRLGSAGAGEQPRARTSSCPRSSRRPADKDENFAVYKVYATHQAGHLEFRSFRFRFDRAGAVLGNRRLERDGRAGRAKSRRLPIWSGSSTCSRIASSPPICSRSSRTPGSTS